MSQKYDRKFKLNAIKLYRESQKSLSSIAEDLGIAKSTFYAWISEFKENGEGSFPGSGKLKPQNEEVYQLRKELAAINLLAQFFIKKTVKLSKMRAKRFLVFGPFKREVRQIA